MKTKTKTIYMVETSLGQREFETEEDAILFEKYIMRIGEVRSIMDSMGLDDVGYLSYRLFTNKEKVKQLICYLNSYYDTVDLLNSKGIKL